MAVNMARWRVQSNNLYLPYADLDTAGNVGRQLLIPDDVQPVLSYQVLQTVRDFRTAKADLYGSQQTVSAAPAFTVGYTSANVIAGNATLVLTLPQRMAFWNMFSSASGVRVTFTHYETGIPIIATFANATPASITVSAMVISILNTTATQTTVTVNAFQY